MYKSVITRYANANLTRLAVEAYLLVGMLLTVDVLFDLQFVNAVVHGDFHLLMGHHASATHQLLALDTFARSLALALVHYSAYFTVRHFRRSFRKEKLI